MKKLLATLTLLGVLASLITSCNNGPKEGKIKDDQPTDKTKHELITLGGGCYWCVEAVFQQLDGVISSTSGYMGGHIPNPTYEQVAGKFSGHIEVIQVVYDPAVISTEKILEWFWKAHDPTNPLGQGGDLGEPYTSNIFVHSEEQKKIVEASKKAAQANYKKPIVTRIRDVKEFYKADEEHQDYYFRKKGENPYCPNVITPKLKKLNLDY
ncbi:MAG: peptide-methionine (S)-S-oxide reductase [Paracoccaceae bacterium]|jgi:peptide-methionine (S)-S-oxide reductase